MTFVLLGDSHCVAFLDGAAKLHPDVPLSGGQSGMACHFQQPFFTVSGGDVQFTDPDVAARVRLSLQAAGFASLSEARGKLVLSMGLAPAPTLGRLARLRYDFGEDAEFSDRNYLSDAVLTQMVDGAQRDVVAFMRACHELGLLRAVLAGPALQSRSRAWQVFGERAHAIYARFEEPVRSCCADMSIPVIDEHGTKDERGLLRQEYWSDDWAHANADFGAGAVQALLRTVGP